MSRDHDTPGEVRKKPVLWAASAVGAREGPTLGHGVGGTCGGLQGCKEKQQNRKVVTNFPVATSYNRKEQSLLFSLRWPADFWPHDSILAYSLPWLAEIHTMDKSMILVCSNPLCGRAKQLATTNGKPSTLSLKSR